MAHFRKQRVRREWNLLVSAFYWLDCWNIFDPNIVSVALSSFMICTGGKDADDTETECDFRFHLDTSDANTSLSRNAGKRNVLLFFSSDFVLLHHEFTNLSFQLGWWSCGVKGNIQGDKYVPVSKLMWEFHIKKNPLIL